MTTKRKRVHPGDILEIKTPRGLAYVQFTAKHPEYGHAIRVIPGLFTTRPTDFEALANSPKAYFTFYPAGVAVSQGAAEVVASHPVPPGQELPSSYRRCGAISREGKVLAWQVWDGTKDVLRRELSEAERHLPIASIWNHEALVYYLSEEWRPEHDIGIPPEPKSTIAAGPKPRHVRHYLYFSTAKVGKAVAAQLATRGFEVTSRKSADGKNWLVLAEHYVRDGEQFDSTRESLERLAQEHSGQYDGHEIEVASSPE